MSPDDDIQALLEGGDVEAACEALWGRYHLSCTQFLTTRFPGALDDDIASSVADAYMQLRTALLERENDVEWPLRNRLFLFASRRVLDRIRKRSTQRRGGAIEWLFLDAQNGEIGDEAFGRMIDDIVINEARDRLLALRKHIRSPHQRSILTVICESLPERVYLGDFPALLRERGIDPPRPTTLKRSLQELRRKLADDPVLQNLRAQPSP